MRATNQIERLQFFLPLVGGDEDAAALLVQVGDLVRIADDIADQEEADPQEAMADLMTIALAEIPANPFYDANRLHLSHLLGGMFAQWRLSNRFHRSGDEKKETFGFVLRESPEQFALHVIALCVGWPAATTAYEASLYPVIAARTAGETVTTWSEEVA